MTVNADYSAAVVVYGTGLPHREGHDGWDWDRAKTTL